MQIRKNTKAFKTILHLVTECENRADRQDLVRLYITRAGDTVNDRISVEAIQGDAALFYEMGYQAVLGNLKSPNHQLHVSDDIPGIYYFHSTSNKQWDETPFEFDEAIRKQFGSLPELPVLRKKEKKEKFVIPSRTSRQESAPTKKEKTPRSKVAEPPRVAKPLKVASPARIIEAPTQPAFKLRHKFHFSNVENLVFRQANVSKLDVLNYYNDVADHLLSYLKDRPLWTRLQSDAGTSKVLSAETLFHGDHESIPDWIKTAEVPMKKEKGRMLLCNDREHLLFYVEAGCVEFSPGHCRIRNLESPDYLVVAIDSPESELAGAIDVALTAKEILTGLKLPSFVKTDGMSGLQVYIPLDSKSKFETSRRVAEYICKLIRLKIPNVITLKGSQGYVYGKVSLDHTLNVAGQGMIAPYSLVAGAAPIVAAPLLWEEVNEGLRLDGFNHQTIFKRLKEVGDPFETLLRKKVNADEVLERLEKHYSFLV